MTTRRGAPLRVGGLLPLTTVDFPGRLAAVVFCQGCPWHCRYCHNGHLLGARSPDEIPWEQVTGLLERRRGFLDAVVFSGGEPTAQGALPAAIAEVRALGYRVGLHTGGAYPRRLRALLGQLDWVGLDIKAPESDYPGVTGVAGSGRRAWESLEILADGGVPFEIRTTWCPGIQSPRSLDRLADALAARQVQAWAIQACAPAHALDPVLREEPDSGPPPPALVDTLRARVPGVVVRG